ncbi:hypothetical protein GCM10010300_41600 [Streptomyces olivaceoviridis]|uniref:hypothetical protein n=1 Tax=Streptomyces olivaceoviridis TaxID=1921 RepID=UPI0019C08F1F|nr:hypothetical protein [Streptomyces olivaceoviridis]GGY93209.1 hypothetical protein GCM10010300_41600 [Streptomyces olivaceoviridis]
MADDKETNPAHGVLEQRPGGLAVRGRGARHQADALGEFRYVPPFSLPVRLFVEAEFTGGNVKPPTVRNGHGAAHDVNEDVVMSVHGTDPSRPRPRYHYSYAVFSTAGFGRAAQEYALAHQISLVDLSMPDFAERGTWWRRRPSASTGRSTRSPRRPGHGCTGCAATSTDGSSKSSATTAASSTATRHPPCPGRRPAAGRDRRAPDEPADAGAGGSPSPRLPSSSAWPPRTSTPSSTTPVGTPPTPCTCAGSRGPRHTLTFQLRYTPAALRG